MSSFDKSWKKLRSTLILDNPWYRVRKDAVQLPNGTIIEDYYVSMLKSVVVIFAITEEKNVVFVKQYRYPIQKNLLELPAGTYEDINSAEKIAHQELLEETGYTVESMIHLGNISEYPTKDSHTVSLFLALNAKLNNTPRPENTEEIEVVLLPVNQLISLISKGEIEVSGTIACIMKAMIHLKLIK